MLAGNVESLPARFFPGVRTMFDEGSSLESERIPLAGVVDCWSFAVVPFRQLEDAPI